MKIRKNKGAKAVPCGMPERTLHKLLHLLSKSSIILAAIDRKENSLSKLREGLEYHKKAGVEDLIKRISNSKPSHDSHWLLWFRHCAKS